MTFLPLYLLALVVLAINFEQGLIALDQWINTRIHIKGDGWGKADETLSARAHRLRGMNPWPERVIDILFFWQPNHCRSAYESEMNRRQLPKEYQ